MALISVWGEAGCRHEEAARLTAQRLGFELITERRVAAAIAEEFGEAAIPDKAWRYVVTSLLARFALERHLVVSVPGSALLFRGHPGQLRIHVTAPEQRRVGNLMLDHRIERPAARQMLREKERELAAERRARFGRVSTPAHLFDLVINAESMDPDQIAALIQSAAEIRSVAGHGHLAPAAEAQVQFQVRLALSRHGIAPPHRISLKRRSFSHPSEEMFANLLDFYRIAWEYEPRSFPIQWDKDGKVLEAFTPDFYLPELDLYVELTTMKQSLVTKKNRKVKLLRSIYPHLNIQIFYQKDFQNLIFKYGLVERTTSV